MSATVEIRDTRNLRRFVDRNGRVMQFVRSKWNNGEGDYDVYARDEKGQEYVYGPCCQVMPIAEEQQT